MVLTYWLTSSHWPIVLLQQASGWKPGPCTTVAEGRLGHRNRYNVMKYENGSRATGCRLALLVAQVRIGGCREQGLRERGVQKVRVETHSALRSRIGAGLGRRRRGRRRWWRLDGGRCVDTLGPPLTIGTAHKVRVAAGCLLHHRLTRTGALLVITCALRLCDTLGPVLVDLRGSKMRSVLSGIKARRLRKLLTACPTEHMVWNMDCQQHPYRLALVEGAAARCMGAILSCVGTLQERRAARNAEEEQWGNVVEHRARMLCTLLSGLNHKIVHIHVT